MTKFAFIFPGQGSQFIGMGKDLAEAFPEAKAVFDEVDDALGQKLSDLIWSVDLHLQSPPSEKASFTYPFKSLRVQSR